MEVAISSSFCNRCWQFNHSMSRFMKKSEKHNKTKVGIQSNNEAFREWMEKKQDVIKKKQEEKEFKMKLMDLDLEKQRIKQEAAELNFSIWLKKKEYLKKAEKQKKQKELEILEKAKQEKIKKSEETVAKWMKESKYKPKSVRSNMGLASLNDYAISFTNPKPWIDLIEN
uniref:Coiled-coil domain-containing protein n=2 Tax=Clastoptera arizonana TaxID=38151 RepID=A0A1B6CMU4_9HEMI